MLTYLIEELKGRRLLERRARGAARWRGGAAVAASARCEGEVVGDIRGCVVGASARMVVACLFVSDAEDQSESDVSVERSREERE